MKKSLIVAAVMLSVCFIAYKVKAAAGNQYNWGTQNGGGWSTPDDSKTTAGQVLQIGSGGGAVVGAASTGLVIFSASTTTINGLTPATTGQMIFATNGLFRNEVCISTGILSSQWVILNSTINSTQLCF